MAYQENRQDLLINTEWGIHRARMSPAVAQERGFVLFLNRWVNKDSLKILRKENRTYEWIYITGWVGICAAIVCFYVVIFEPDVAEVLPYGGLVALIVNALLSIVCTIGLWKFKKWARWLTTVNVVFTFSYTGHGLLVAFYMLYYLHNSVAKQIFNGSNPDVIKSYKEFLVSSNK